ncbi:TPA: hypothetical protein JBH59_02890 [Legionella pneumophila]|uniref:hypothetical protein n=1 Tax=Legionella pneumophila TaxID=446 RepID=UPI001A32EA0F|nr:hypothetical protein [Legionella pneumophila]MDI9826318.1 hypothetical protein [Legionella pneumophila]HAU0908754.1 hypothetical protein [Legionella pneumophila]HAU1359040.1 hypothetical protein [Legionella pneumophila]HAU1458290.1 hypothetical protein [Legionella pneumophila]HBD7357242.1 hypothetical protein [Legionella pneumophila]
MELQLGVDIDFFEKIFIRTLEQEIFHNLSSVIEYALKLSIGNYLSKFNHLIKNDFISDTVIKCIIPTTLTHGFGFNFLDRKLTFNLSTKLKIKKSDQGEIYFNPLIDGVNMEFFPIKSGYIINNGNFKSDSVTILWPQCLLVRFMNGRIISNNYFHEIEFTRIAKKDILIKALKKQTNIYINRLKFSLNVANVLNHLSPNLINKLNNKFIPEWFYLCDFEIFNCKHQEITYFNYISGKRYICSCSEEFHEHLLKSNPPTERKDNLLMLSDIVCLPRYKNICHLCILQKDGFEKCIIQYGIPDKKLKYCFSPISFYYRKDPKWFWIYHNLEYIFKKPRWVNENNMFLFAKELLPEYKIIREASPSWLGNQSLDVYFPEIALALEYQGKQHLEPVDFFGGESSFLKNQERDLRKNELCKKNNVTVVYVYYNENLTLELMKRKLNNFIKKLRDN